METQVNRGSSPLCGMLLIPTTIFRSLATGAITVVLVAVAASLTLLPAILGVMGDKVNAGKVPFLYRRRNLDSEHTRGFWGRVARTVMGRPVVSGLAALTLLLAVAMPVFGIRTGFSGISTYPNDVQSKRAFTVLSRDFSGGLAEPAQIVVDGNVRASAVQSAIKELQAELAKDPMFGPSEVQSNKAGTLALQQRSYPDAVKLFRDARKLFPDDLVAADGLSKARYGRAMLEGQQALAQRRKADATRAFEAALAERPGDPAAQNGLRQARVLR